MAYFQWGTFYVIVLAEEKQNYGESIIDYRRRAPIIYQLYTLVPNNLSE